MQRKACRLASPSFGNRVLRSSSGTPLDSIGILQNGLKQWQPWEQHKAPRTTDQAMGVPRRDDKLKPLVVC